MINNLILRLYNEHPMLPGVSRPNSEFLTPLNSLAGPEKIFAWILWKKIAHKLPSGWQIWLNDAFSALQTLITAILHAIVMNNLKMKFWNVKIPLNYQILVFSLVFCALNSKFTNVAIKNGQKCNFIKIR